MGAAKVLVVAGTHGNERNAPWLLEHWRRHPGALQTGGLELELVVGNPEALAAGVRYLDQDLNRSFLPDLLSESDPRVRERDRARELVSRYGPSGTSPCVVALDLHSTTAAMGNSLVLYGRRTGDLALAAGIQARLGLPVYLHEGDASQSGFLVERWPCGVVIEVGPVPQGVITATVCRQTQLALEAALDTLAAARAGRFRLPAQLTVHRHLGSLDLPRHPDGSPAACIHPRRQHRDWHPLAADDPLFLTAGGMTLNYEPEDPSPRWPVFINEAAYGEKGIALSLTNRERWECPPAWAEALASLGSDLAGGSDRSD
jgi:aspartoacylase